MDVVTTMTSRRQIWLGMRSPLRTSRNGKLYGLQMTEVGEAAETLTSLILEVNEIKHFHFSRGVIRRSTITGEDPMTVRWLTHLSMANCSHSQRIG